MKTALDVYSFARLLNIMYAKIDNTAELIEESLKSIEEKTQTYNKILEECYTQHSESQNKHNKALELTQFNNANKDKKHIITRIALDIATAGLTEFGSLSSKRIGKVVKQKDEQIIASLDQCKKANNPFVECIRNADDLLMLKKLVMRDDKYLYYQI